ncbi:MAG: MFS transporter [Eggerthellaceae bacterium]|nr:MFS transporter [Eggerthellaceae bacterium]
MGLTSLRGKGGAYTLFAIVVLATAIGSFTQTVMNSMLLGVQADFGVEASVSQWLTTIYMLVIGITVPVMTFLSQKYSFRNIVFIALGLFVLGSLIDFVAPNFAVLLAGRVLQATATGITVPLVQVIALTRFPRERVGTMMGIAGIALGFAPNIGPLIGGVLVDSWGWRSFFVIILVVVLVLMLANFLFVTAEENPARSANLDIISLALSTLGFGGLLLGFSNAASLGVSSVLTWLPLAVGAVGLVAFVVRQRRAENPLINLRIFEFASYRVSFLAQNVLNASFMGITLIVPLCVMDLGLGSGTAVAAGLVFIPSTINALWLNPVAGIFVDKVGVRPVALVASVLLLVGSISMVFVYEGMPLWMLTLMQTVRGAGVSLIIGPFITYGMMNLPREISMDGSAFFATTRQACASLGTAAMVLIATFGIGLGLPVLAYQAAFGLSALLAVATFAIVALKIR